MEKWVGQDVKIHSKTGKPKYIRMPTYNGLAMYMLNTNYWSITHVNSGRRITTIEGEQGWSFEIAAEIAKILDWSQYADGKEILQAHPDAIVKINEIANPDTKEGKANEG